MVAPPDEQNAELPGHAGRLRNRCVIHIGMNKTGSSSIQRSLHRFEDGQFLYARIGERRNHSLPIYSLFASQPQQHDLHRAATAEDIRSYNKTISEDLARSISLAAGRTLIISGESISTLPPEDIPRLRDYFDRHFSELMIVGYVRPPAGLMTSRFQQAVKNARVKAFDVAELYGDYRSLFLKFDQVFGRDRVHLWKFDPTTFPDGCVVQDFCTRIGLRLPTSRITRLNDSLSKDAVAALYTYVKFGTDYGADTLKGPEGVRLGQVLHSVKFRLSPDIVRPILEQHRTDIQWMEERLQQSLQEDLSPSPATDVASEADLLRPNPTIAAKLIAALGPSAPAGIRGETPEELAVLVHALRKQLSMAMAQKRMRRSASLDA